MSTPGEKIVNRTVINKDETLCTFSFVYNQDSQGMFAYPQEGVKIKDMVIKKEGGYVYYNNEGNRDKTNSKTDFAKELYDKQKIKFTDGVLTPEEAKGGSKRKSKSQRRKKSIKKSIKRRH